MAFRDTPSKLAEHMAASLRMNFMFVFVACAWLFALESELCALDFQGPAESIIALHDSVCDSYSDLPALLPRALIHDHPAVTAILFLLAFFILNHKFGLHRPAKLAAHTSRLPAGLENGVVAAAFMLLSAMLVFQSCDTEATRDSEEERAKRFVEYSRAMIAVLWLFVIYNRFREIMRPQARPADVAADE